MRLYIIGNVCSISASATAIQPTNIPTHNPNIAIKIFPQILLTGTLGIFAKPRLYAVSSTDDILPATTPHIMTFSISIIFSILLHRSMRGTTPITSTNANTPADTPAPAKNAITDKNKILEALKVAAVCILIFFGSAFTIMAFNNDISISGVFEHFYKQIMGVDKPQVSVLEVFYCIGLAVGIILFFNHIGKRKLSDDVTPIQVEMDKHNKDTWNTIIDKVKEKQDV